MDAKKIRARERKLRARYQRNLKIAIVVCLLLGLAGGFALGRVTAPKTTAAVNPVPTPAPTPAATEVPQITLAPTAVPTAVPTPTAVPVRSAIVVPFGAEQVITAQINSDGTVRTDTSTTAYDTLNFRMSVQRYLTPEYYTFTYASQYRLQGDEAGVEFALMLSDYMGTQQIMPQNVLSVCLKTADGQVENGFQLTGTEIQNAPVTLTTNIPATVYKRFDFNSALGDMTYLSVTAVVDGVSQEYLFELGDPIRPTPVPTQAPTPVPTYAPIEIGANGPDVVTLQSRLIDMGYLYGSADGDFGQYTQDAIKAAQEDLGLDPTGIADDAFLRAIYGTN